VLVAYISRRDPRIQSPPDCVGPVDLESSTSEGAERSIWCSVAEVWRGEH